VLVDKGRCTFFVPPSRPLTSLRHTGRRRTDTSNTQTHSTVVKGVSVRLQLCMCRRISWLKTSLTEVNSLRKRQSILVLRHCMTCLLLCKLEGLYMLHSNCMKHTPSWETDSWPDSQEIFLIYGFRKFINMLSAVHTFSQHWARLVQSTSPSQLISSSSDLILSCHVGFIFRLPHQSAVCSSVLLHKCHIAHPLYSAWLYHPCHV